MRIFHNIIKNILGNDNNIESLSVGELFFEPLKTGHSAEIKSVIRFNIICLS